MAAKGEEAKAKEKAADAIQLAVDKGDVTFNLTHQYALKRLPESIRNLKSTLQILHIDNNYELSAIPSSIGELSNLRWLNLGYNNLTTLPAEIGKLRNLERLYVNNNHITELPLEVWALKKLEELHVESNQLQALPTGVLLMRNLRELFHSNNRWLTEADVDGADPFEIFPEVRGGDCANCLIRFKDTYRVTCSFQQLCNSGVNLPFVHYVCGDRCLSQLLGRLEQAANGQMSSPGRIRPPPAEEAE